MLLLFLKCSESIFHNWPESLKGTLVHFPLGCLFPAFSGAPVMAQSVILVCVQHLSTAVPQGHRTVGLGQAHVSEARELGLFCLLQPE